MSKVEQVRWRLLGEQLGRVHRAAQDRQHETRPEGVPADPDAEILLRLAGAVLALLDWHATDSRGRCRVRGCTRRLRLPWRAQRPCHVFVTVHFWLHQPLPILRKVEKKWSWTQDHPA